MSSHLTLLVAVLLLSLPGIAPAAEAHHGDEELIRRLEMDQAAAWNAHDAVAYAQLFTPGGDVVNVVGWWWRGRDAIQSKLAGAFAHAFRDSTLTITATDIRFLADNLAIAHVQWTMSGAVMPAGLPVPKAGIQLQVLRRQGGKWLIESFQNTNSLPEQALAGPPHGDKKSP